MDRPVSRMKGNIWIIAKLGLRIEGRVSWMF